MLWAHLILLWGTAARFVGGLVERGLWTDPADQQADHVCIEYGAVLMAIPAAVPLAGAGFVGGTAGLRLPWIGVRSPSEPGAAIDA